MLRFISVLSFTLLVLAAAFGRQQKLTRQPSMKPPSLHRTSDQKAPLRDVPSKGIKVSRDSRFPQTTPTNWLIIMQRSDGSLNFNRTWNEYRNGFGELGGQRDFWLGNEMVHHLTLGNGYTLRIEIQTGGAWYYADYATFFLDSESNKYAIRVSGFSGNATDSLTNTSVGSIGYHDGMSFSTTDVDNDKTPSGDCANDYGGGWWHNACYMSCLTCEYGTAFEWRSLIHLPSNGRLEAARMMIKRRCA